MAVIKLTNEMALGDYVPVKEKEGYKILAGGLGVINSEGHMFPATQEIRELFMDNSALVRRATSGALKAETNHPSQEPGETKEAFVRRFMSINEQKVCALINKIEIGDTPITMKGQEQGFYPVWIWVEPIGQFGKGLQSDLDSENSNTAFSIRCLSKRGTNGGRVTRSIFHIVTWDWVNEPGINVAKKSAWVTQESMEIDSGVLQTFLSHGDDLTVENADNYKSVLDYLERCESGVCKRLEDW